MLKRMSRDFFGHFLKNEAAIAKTVFRFVISASIYTLEHRQNFAPLVARKSPLVRRMKQPTREHPEVLLAKKIVDAKKIDFSALIANLKTVCTMVSSLLRKWPKKKSRDIRFSIVRYFTLPDRAPRI